MEDYNELVFVDPNPSMLKLLMVSGASGADPAISAASKEGKNTDGTQADQDGEENKAVADEVAVAVANASSAPATTQKKYWPAVHKAYDHAAIMKGYKDREFDTKERQDLDNLRMALSFVQKQVAEKRRKISELEYQVNHERFKVRAKRNQVYNIQDQINADKMWNN